MESVARGSASTLVLHVIILALERMVFFRMIHPPAGCSISAVSMRSGFHHYPAALVVAQILAIDATSCSAASP